MRLLTQFKGYIVDSKREEFRRLEDGDKQVVISFNSEQGKELTDQMWLDGQLFLQHESGDVEAWICICGNRPGYDGFYPCDWEGNEVEPTEATWPHPLYVCAACGRIIDAGFREFVVSSVEGKETEV